MEIPSFLFTTLLALSPAPVASYGQSANQGGAYVYWEPSYPVPTYDAYEGTMTVVQLPNVQSYYYWALQNGFAGGGVFYMGLQPYGSCGITNAGNCKIVLFSFFGNGASSTSPNCAPGADGGPGEQCRVAYDWVIGVPYTFRATLTANDGVLETWTGTVTDQKSGATTTIGSWSIPASQGLIGTQGVSFVEYYQLYSGGCSAEPYAEIVWNTPIGYNKGQSYPGAVGSTAPTSGCPGNSVFTVNLSSVTVQTGSWSLDPVPDYFLTASDSAFWVGQGQSCSLSTISVTPMGAFASTVAFTASELPAGVTASFCPASTATTTALTLSASAVATVGPAAVTVTGTSGNSSHTLAIDVLVTAGGKGATELSDFGTNGTFSVNGWCVSGASTTNCGPATTRYIAASFAPCSSFTLSTILLPLSYISGSNGAVINLMSNSGGVPGALLESWSVSNLPSGASLTSIPSKLSPVLQSGRTYWVEVEPLAADSLLYWNTNNLGLAGGRANLGEAGWTALSGYSGQTLPAFGIAGSAASPPGPRRRPGSDYQSGPPRERCSSEVPRIP